MLAKLVALSGTIIYRLCLVVIMNRLARTGQVIWNGSIVLGKIMEQQSPIPLDGSSVLELGAGCCGIPGQIASALGAHVVLTDIRDELTGLQSNVSLNMHCRNFNINVEELDWCDVMSKIALPQWMDGLKFDLILCADLVYEKTYKPLAVTLLLILKGNPNAVVLMSNAMRKHVHLFRRKMNLFCNFYEIEADVLSNFHDVAWIIKLKQDIDMSQLHSVFAD